MNPCVLRSRTGLVAWLMPVFVLICAHAGLAQNGGVINPGSGRVGDPFVLYKVTCTIKGNTPHSPNPEQAGARWRPVGAKNWYRSVDAVYLPPATYQVEFKANIRHWITPGKGSLVVNKTKAIIAVYHRRD